MASSGSVRDSEISRWRREAGTKDRQALPATHSWRALVFPSRLGVILIFKLTHYLMAHTIDFNYWRTYLRGVKPLATYESAGINDTFAD